MNFLTISLISSFLLQGTHTVTLDVNPVQGQVSLFNLSIFFSIQIATTKYYEMNETQKT